MEKKRYRIWKQGRFMRSRVPGRFAIVTTQGVFGRLDCSAGKKAFPQNRIFVHTYEDAIAYGARPCMKCNPKPEDTYYRCGGCGAFIATDIAAITSCECGRLTIKPMGRGLVLISGRPGAHKRIGPKKKPTPA